MSVEAWTKSSGMDWEIKEAPVQYARGEGAARVLGTFEDQRVLYRSDTGAPLSVVGGKYKVVQPRAVMEFFRDLTEVAGYELEAAGAFRGGRRFWAMARMGKEVRLGGSDLVCGYLLLASSCDGSLATVATPTTFRVVCSNTLAVALHGAPDAIRVPHSTDFDGQLVKAQLGIAVSQWDAFLYRMKELASRKVKSPEALTYFLKVMGPGSGHELEPGVPNERAIRRAQALYEADGKGAHLATAKGTAWGLLNAVTQYVDHERRARTADSRMDSAWFGSGAALKQRALDEAVALIA